MKARPDLGKRTADGVHLGVLCALAAFCAYMPMHLLALRQSFWGAITAIAVTRMELRAAETTARKQFSAPRQAADTSLKSRAAL